MSRVVGCYRSVVCAGCGSGISRTPAPGPRGSFFLENGTLRDASTREKNPDIGTITSQYETLQTCGDHYRVLAVANTGNTLKKGPHWASMAFHMKKKDNF